MKTKITPTKAKSILENNIINRAPNKHNIGYLADEILKGQFVYNGESIIISDEGHLLDGQHRLMACIEANMPITVNLVEGIPFDAMTTIDTGRSRNAADVLAMNGIQNTTAMATAIKRIISKFDTDRSSHVRSETSKNSLSSKK